MTSELSNVPMVDLTRQYFQIKNEIDNEVSVILSSGKYVLGPQVEIFEKNIADYLQVEHAVAVGSGTDALYLILRAYDVSEGDEVITTPFTFIATADTISTCGAKPVFADINPRTFNIDPDKIQESINKNTKAIIAVHLYGQPADMGRITEVANEKQIPVIEDCAQSFGSTYHGVKAGSIGDASAFSFFPTKNLGCAGDGGMVCTNNEELAAKVRMLRAHGSKRKYYHELIGTNSRLDTIQAAILSKKLKYLDRWNTERQEIAEFYNRHLSGVQVPFVTPGSIHVYHQYTILTKRRDDLQSKLSESGIGSAVYYYPPLHLQPCYSPLGYKPGDFPVCEETSSHVLSLPVFPGMTEAECAKVCEAVNNIVNQKK